jgi:hypothetical protein
MVSGAEVETALDPSEFVGRRKKVVEDSCMMCTALVENHHTAAVGNLPSASVSAFPLFTRIYL